MMHLDRYPADAAAAIRQFAPAVSRWATAAGGIDDVRQEIVVAVLCGQNPTAAVPVALGLRRLTTGWRSNDPAVAAHLAGCVIDEEYFEAESDTSEPKVDATGLATALFGGTEAVARQSDIGRWVAQLRVKKQLRRFEAGGDLFGGEREMAAETRNIPTNIDAWPAIANLLPDQKWIYVLLWLKCTNEIGVWLLELAAFGASASVSLSALGSALDDFERRGLLKRDGETGEILITAWFRWHKFVSAPRQRLLVEGLRRIASPILKELAVDSAMEQGHISDKSTIYRTKQSKQNKNLSTRDGEDGGVLPSQIYPLTAAAFGSLLSIAKSKNPNSDQDRDFASARRAINQLESDSLLTDDQAAGVVSSCHWPSEATKRLLSALKDAAVVAQQCRRAEEESRKNQQLLGRHRECADALEGRMVQFPDGTKRRVVATGITYKNITYSLSTLKEMLASGEIALC